MTQNQIFIKKHDVDGKNLFFSILLNIIITVSQVVGGLFSGSLALISDALHNFSDVLSLIFSYVAHRLSRHKASVNQTFGYKRAGIMAAFCNAILLILVAFFLIYEATHRLLNPTHISATLVIWLSILGILANGFSVLLLKDDAQHNLNMKSAYLHLLTDTMASVAVLMGGLFMRYFSWYWVDSVLTIVIALYLIYVGADLLFKSVHILMLFTPKEINVKELVRDVHKIEGIKKLHHIHIWQLNDEELHLEAHLDCDNDLRLSEFNQILSSLESLLFSKYKINHITIQPEYSKEDPKRFIVQD